MNIKAKLDTAVAKANSIVEGAKAAARSMTPDETQELEGLIEEIKGYRAQIEAGEKGDALARDLGDLIGGEKGGQSGGYGSPSGSGETRAKTVGAHFVKHLGDRSLKNPGTIAVPEFKAASDTHVTGGPDGDLGAALTDVDRTIVTEYRRPTVLDVLGTGSISGQAITYYIEGAREGDFGTVAENGAKPQLHYENPTPITDRLKEIAGWIRLSDDMVDDLDFVVSEINTRLLYDLSLKEESQVLKGDGSGNNLTGILERSGIQTETAADPDDLADALFRAMMKVQTVTGLAADAVLIHPSDYQNLRLAKDGNEQYYGGGFFAGQYGQNGIVWQPPIWGANTVVTPAVSQGAPVVGAFKQATTLYRKGGVRVESTNSHDEDFIHDRIAIRAKSRLALAVRRPSAIVALNIDGGGGGGVEG